MKKLFIITTLFTFSLFSKTDVSNLPNSLPMSSYIVKEVGSGEVLMSKNKTKRIAPASLTKILTSTLAIESGRLAEYVTITKEAVSVQPTKAGFKIGDEVLLLDLVKAALVNSSNDAATAIGIHVGGSTQAFAQMMNKKAEQIGMKNSNFTNACGFDIGDHYSTAEDLLKLSEYAIKNRIFNEIVKLDEVTITPRDGSKVFKLGTHNKLLDKYKYAIGVKTGFTNKAGSCLIARAQKDNKDILVIMLKSKTNRWILAEDMFEKAFSMTKPEEEVVENDKAISPAGGNIARASTVSRASSKAQSRTKTGQSHKRIAKKDVKSIKKRVKREAKARGINSRG